MTVVNTSARPSMFYVACAFLLAVGLFSAGCGNAGNEAAFGDLPASPSNLANPASGFGSLLRASEAGANLAECLGGSSAASCFSRVAILPASITSAAATAPGAPVNLAVSSSGSSVTLTWVAPLSGDPVTVYIIEAGSAPGLANLANFSTGNAATSFSASGVGGGTYYVRVRAVNSAGVSAASNEGSLIVGGGPCATPGAPNGLGIVSNSGGTVVLAWSAGSGSPSSYIIEAGSAPGLSNLANNDLGSAATTVTTTGVPGGTYYVRVRARNTCGTSAPSNETTLTVGPPACPSTPLGTATLEGVTVGGNILGTDCDAPHRPGANGDLFTFQATAGTTIVVAMLADFDPFDPFGLDPYLILVGPDGAVVSEDDDSALGSNAALVWPVLQSGTYTIEATTKYAQNRGGYKLTLKRIVL